MAQYRLDVLDGQNFIRQAFDVACTDDGEAVLRARKYTGGAGVEVWQGTRRVARLPTEPKRSEAVQ